MIELLQIVKITGVKITKKAPKMRFIHYGRSDRTRTYNQRFWRPLLYQLSYTPMERKTRFELATPALARRCSTAELFPHVMVPQDRIELSTHGFSVHCSTDWATEATMATPIRFELTIFAVTGRHVNRYTTGPFFLCVSLSREYFVSILVSALIVKRQNSIFYIFSA